MQDNVSRHSVFLWHSSHTSDLAYQLAADLKDIGLDVWVEPRIDLINSEDFWASQGQYKIILPVLSADETLSEQKWLTILQEANQHDLQFIPLVQLFEVTELTQHLGQLVNFASWKNEPVYKRSLEKLIHKLEEIIPIREDFRLDPESSYINHLVAEIKRYRIFLETISPRSDTLPLDKRAIYAHSMWGLTGEFETANPVANNTTYQFHEILEKYPQFVLLGKSGSGKSITLYRTLLDAIRAYQADREQYPIPLMVHLGMWEEDITLESLLRKFWTLPSDPIELAAEGKLLLLFDGLDEIGYPRHTKINRLKGWIQGEKSPQRLVISCRTDNYESLYDLAIPIVHLKEIDTPRIRQYVTNHLSKETAEQLFRQILADHTEFPTSKLSQNALLLSILVSYIQHYPKEAIPNHEAPLLHWLTVFLWESIPSAQNLSFERALPDLSQLAVDAIEDELATYFTYDYARTHLGNDLVLQHALDVSLLQMRDGYICFCHQKIRDVLAAYNIFHDGVYKRLMRPQFDNNGKRIRWKWDEPIMMCSGLSTNLSTTIKEIVQVDPFLALECLGSGIKVSERTLNDVANHLIEYSIYTDDQHLDQLREAMNIALNANAASAVLESLHRHWQSTSIFTSHKADEELTMLLKKLGADTVRMLVDILRGERWQRRSSAAWALGELREPAAVPSLIEALNDENEAVRKEALQALLRIGKPAVPRLISVLEAENVDLRAAAVKLLGRMQEPTAVDALIKRLPDIAWPTMEEARICDLAANALESIATDDALKAVDIWRQGGKPSAQSSEWGEKVRDQSQYSVRHNATSEQLFTSLDSKDWAVRRDAIKKLGEGSNVVALPYIIRAIHDEDSQVRLAAVEALKRFNGVEVVQALINALNDEEPFVCDAATTALTTQGELALTGLIQAITDSNPNVRGAAAEVLGVIGDEQAIPYLVDVLTDTETPHLETRRICDIAAHALEQINTEKALFALNQWRKEQGIAYGLPALDADMPLLHLDRLNTYDDTDRAALLEFLDTLHESDWQTRQIAAKHLHKFAKSIQNTDNATQVAKSLSSALTDDESLVRWSAAEALALIGDTDAIPALLNALNDTNWTVRVAAIRAIAEIETQDAIHALTNALHDQYSIVREAAAETLGKIGDVSAADALLQVLNDDEDNFVRFAAVQALGEIGDSLVIPHLIQLLDDADISMRWASVEALGKIGSTTAIPFLVQCLNDVSSPEWEDRRLCDVAAEALEMIGTQPARDAVTAWRAKQPD